MRPARRVGWMLLLIGPISWACGQDTEREGPLDLADVADYLSALDAGPRPAPRSATFRMLWDQPEALRGAFVRVEGTVERRFRQDAVGKLPALTELWIIDREQNPICLVFATPATTQPAQDAAPGARVRFDGTYLRRLRYRGGDTDRLAPLVVGPGMPQVVRPAVVPGSAGGSVAVGFSGLEWAMGLGAGGFVLLALLRTLARRPQPRRTELGGAPEFVEPEA